MSARKAFVLLVSLSAIAFLAACGGSGPAPANATPPPSGTFSNASLNGTYVFSVSGTDASGASIAIAGTLTANGSGTITAGALDMNDVEFTAATPNLPVKSSSYNITVDGRGTTQLNVTTPFGNTLTFDFVLQDPSHGFISEFDQNATGSGTIDLQSSGTPTGSYSFILSGGIVVSSTSESALASVGNFAVSSGGDLTGSADFNAEGSAYPDQSLSGKVVLGPSSTPSTTFTTAAFSTQTFDVIAVDANHLKFIEMDPGATLSGDAFSETSTAVPVGPLAFTMVGVDAASGATLAIGGVMTTTGTTLSGSDDFNSGGVTISPSAVSFTGTYTTSGARSELTLASFTLGTTYAAYPSSGGLLMLEIDSAGMMSGAAYSQSTSAALGVPQGFALNLSGENTGEEEEGEGAAEVDDIAEFATASGGNLTGIIDENSPTAGQTVVSIPLDGTFATGSGGGTITATANNGTTGTLEGVLNLAYFTVDGTTFPFIEMDSGQVSTGVFVLQSPTGSSSAVAKSHAMYVPHPFIHPHGAKQKKR